MHFFGFIFPEDGHLKITANKEKQKHKHRKTFCSTSSPCTTRPACSPPGRAPPSTTTRRTSPAPAPRRPPPARSPPLASPRSASRPTASTRPSRWSSCVAQPARHANLAHVARPQRQQHRGAGASRIPPGWGASRCSIKGATGSPACSTRLCFATSPACTSWTCPGTSSRSPSCRRKSAR
jgi:hypothetical protein